MFFRLLLESFVRQRRRKLLAGIAILLGTTAVTAMLALATTIGDRIHKELAVYGANIIVTPQAGQLDVKIGGVDIKPATGNAYLHESSLPKLKAIFWANNITGINPELLVDVRFGKPGGPFYEAQGIGLWFGHAVPQAGGPTLRTGAVFLHPSWKIQGSWPEETNSAPRSSDAVLGSELATKVGAHIGDVFDALSVSKNGRPAVAGPTGGFRLRVVGIANTGDAQDRTLLLPLNAAQILTGLPDAVSRVEVSARTKPEDAFARVDPDSLPPKQREIWYCRPYANSIAYQIREAIPGAQAEQVRQVEQTEGTILSRISGLMWFISAAALLAAGFAVSAAMATAVLERRGEIGLMRSLGASKGAIALLFYAETGLLALFAGTLGYIVGSGLAAWLGSRIFLGEAPAAAQVFIPVLLPVVVATALIVAVAGSTPSIRSALKMDPSAVLRADA